MKHSAFFRSVLLATGIVIHARAQSSGYVFSTLAGQALLGSADGPASAARFAFPNDVAADKDGNVYVADSNNHTIRKISPAGVVSTLAGQADQPGSADGTGRAARFMFPDGVAVDQAGTVYVADARNCTIRRITPTGVVTTLAGQAGVSGSADGAGNAARFNFPVGVAVDANGNIYVADEGNATIRQITPAGVVTTLAGQAGSTGTADGTGSTARFIQPIGVAVDGAGNVFVSDFGARTIRKVTPVGEVTTLAGQADSMGSADGLGQAAQFSFPAHLASDKNGDLYLADSLNSTIRKISPLGMVTTVAGLAGQSGEVDGVGDAARFTTPFGVAVDPVGNVYVADTGGSTIREITPGGVVTTVAGATGGSSGIADGIGPAARFAYPEGVAVDLAGNAYVSDSSNHTIRKITPTGVVTTFAGAPGQSGSTDGPGSVARFNFPNGVAVDARGNVYVADEGNSTVRKITSAGVVSTLAGQAGDPASVDGPGGQARFVGPGGIAVDRQGNVYISDRLADTIRKITPDGRVSTLAGQAGMPGSVDGAGTVARFSFPEGVAVDAEKNVYVAQGNGVIRKITPDGMVSTFAGKAGSPGNVDGTGADARLSLTGGIVVDRLGTIYVTDTHNTIRQVSPAGVVTTVAGTAGVAGGLDGDDSVVQFNLLGGLAVDFAGDLFIADSGNNTIRKGVPPILVAPAITTLSANPTVPADGSVTFTVATEGLSSSSTRWQFNGTDLAGATAPTLALAHLQPVDTGLYTAVVADGTTSTSSSAILGLSSVLKVIGAGAEILADQQVAANRNTFDQVALTGAAATITADPGQITRISFIDLNDDIVQVEFSGAGSLSLVLNEASGPAAPEKYHQPGVTYMKGHAGIVIVGADETTNVSVFSVGPLTAVNQALFKSGVSYDGVADIAYLAILSANGRFGSVRTGDASYSATKGYAGVYAPGVMFTGPVYIGDISASDAATPVLLLGGATSAPWITGGNLFQPNHQALKVSGFTQLEFKDGTTSNNARLPAQTNQAQLQLNGPDSTAPALVGSHRAAKSRRRRSA